MGMGDWELGIGDWELDPNHNPQSPIPNPQSPIIIYKGIFQNINILILKLSINQN